MNTWTARLIETIGFTSTTFVLYSEPLESYLIEYSKPLESYLIETNGSLTATTCTQYCKATLIKYISFSSLAIA